MNKSVDTNEIKLDISENFNKNAKIVVPRLPIFPVPKFMKRKSLKELISERTELLNTQFITNFKFSSTDVQYKSGLFFTQVKLVLEPNRLVLHKLNSKESPDNICNPLLVLDFDFITANLSAKEKSNKFSINVLGHPKKFIFQAKNEEILHQIIIHLNVYLEQSKGSKRNLLGVSLRKDFTKFYYIYENDFKNKAQTGDLLIFRGLECTARCQRCFTLAHYDHVALLMKKHDMLFVYESTSKDGCMMRTWREFLVNAWNLYYDKMVYRQLLIDNKETNKEQILIDLQTKCDEFYKETQRKNYTLSCCSIMCAKRRDYEEKNEWSKSPGFFCSQLIAAAYLKAGILTYNKGTGYYLPGSFAHTSTLKLQKPYSLGPEYIIEFS